MSNIYKSKAYDEGWTAFYRGIKMDWAAIACPYLPNSTEYQEWFDGFDAAENEFIYKSNGQK